MMRLEIDGWSQGLKFSASHFIPGHAKCGRLHGHTYAVSAVIEGTQGKDSMVVDFTEIKDAISSICECLDHMVIIPENSKDVQVKANRKSVKILSVGKRYVFPASDVVFISVSVPSAEELARYVLSRLLKAVKLPSNVSAVEICVEEGKGQGAWARETL